MNSKFLDDLADKHWFLPGRNNHNYKIWAAGAVVEQERFRTSLEWLRGGFTKDKTAENLEEMAVALSPGGAGASGALVNEMRDCELRADPKLIAAMMWYNWSGRRLGFLFLPDPANIDWWDYRELAGEVYDTLRGSSWGTGDPSWSPRDLLTNTYSPDLDFYDSLPNRFTVYRGAHGITSEQCAAGICWTTDKSTAIWFANTGKEGTEPVLVSRSVPKSEIAAARACEMEVVVLHGKWRELKCPKKDLSKWRPDMHWSKPVELKTG